MIPIKVSAIGWNKYIDKLKLDDSIGDLQTYEANHHKRNLKALLKILSLRVLIIIVIMKLLIW